MEKQTGKQLLKKLKEGNISPEELQLLESWYEDYISKAAPFNNASAFLKDMEILDKAFPFETEHLSGKTTTYKLWPRVVSVAASVALIVIGVYLFNYRNNETLKQVQDEVVNNDVAPGKIGATLILASGKKIRLSDATNGELANEAGVSITKSADGQLVYEVKGSNVEGNKINTLSTARGETYQIKLPDGSKVWLNAASSLTYPAALNEGGVRSVELEGEGYFEVSKDKNHPFVVKSKGQQVEVLGTHFNINTYQDEGAIKTSLIEGAVRVTLANGQKAIIKPRQQTVVANGSLKVEDADLEQVMAWKNNEFAFDNEPIENIMKMLERWYNVEVIYIGEKPKDKFVGSVSRFENVSKVLRIMESTGKIHFKIEERTIYVSQ